MSQPEASPPGRGTSIRAIAPERTHALRQRILRRHQPISEMEYPGDREADTVHLGAFDAERLVGIASLYREPWREDPRPGDWRLRGMTVEDRLRGAGVGAALLQACIDHVRGAGGKRLWCNARTPAQGFYERFGLTTRSAVWEEEGIGPHVVMALDVDRASPASPQDGAR